MRKSWDFDFKELLKYMKKRWYICVIIIVLFTLLGAFVGIKKNASEPVAASISTEVVPPSDLTEEEILFVDELVALFNARKQMLEEFSTGSLESLEELNYVNSLLTSMKNELSVHQTDYYNSIVAPEKGIVKAIATPIPKWILFGLAMGLVFGLMSISLPFIFSDKITNAKSISNIYEICDLGSMENINKIVQKRGFHAVYFLGANIPEKYSSPFDIIDADCIVLILVLNETTHEDIENSLCIAKQYELPILGYVILPNNE